MYYGRYEREADRLANQEVRLMLIQPKKKNSLFHLATCCKHLEITVHEEITQVETGMRM